MTKFQKWNDTQQFHEVVRNLNYHRINEFLKARNFKLDYMLKIKLHGTNACVRIESDGKVAAQKRSSDTGPFGHFGFAEWVKDNEAYFASLADSAFDTYVYGEWAGPGVQQGVSCSQTDRKFFYVFAVDLYKDGDFFQRIYAPELIEDLICGEEGARNPLTPHQIIVIPVHSVITIDFRDKAECDKALKSLNNLVEQIGNTDPLISSLFGIDGAGEGCVAFPLSDGTGRGFYAKDERDVYSWFNFKAKSEAHRVNKTKQAAAFDPTKLATSHAFADMFCTEQRMQQAFQEAVQEQRDLRLIPSFLKWVCLDIFKESKSEREACPVEWAALSKVCTTRAVLWYKAKVAEGV